MNDLGDVDRLIIVERSYEIIVHRRHHVKLSDSSDEWTEQCCMTTTTERRTHEGDALHEALAASSEETAVFRLVEVSFIFKQSHYQCLSI